MNKIQTAVKKALDQDNIDLILAALAETTVYTIGQEVDGADDPDLLVSPGPNGIMCITAAEDPDLLNDFVDSDPANVLVELDGTTLVALARDELEIMFVFDDGGYCIPRDHIDWWFSEQPA